MQGELAETKAALHQAELSCSAALLRVAELEELRVRDKEREKMALTELVQLGSARDEELEEAQQEMEVLKDINAALRDSNAALSHQSAQLPGKLCGEPPQGSLLSATPGADQRIEGLYAHTRQDTQGIKERLERFEAQTQVLMQVMANADACRRMPAHADAC